jgi:hypothetical protein
MSFFGADLEAKGTKHCTHHSQTTPNKSPLPGITLSGQGTIARRQDVQQSFELQKS